MLLDIIQGLLYFLNSMHYKGKKNCFETSREKLCKNVREKYRMFDAMMQNGIQFYIMKPDVNRLVAFLRNPDNDEEFKKAVQTNCQGKAFADMPSAFKAFVDTYFRTIDVDGTSSK